MSWILRPFRVRNITYDVERNNLAVGLLDLPELAEEIPEPRLGDNVVGRKDAHAVQLRGLVGLRRQVAADDLIFCKTTWRALGSASSRKASLSGSGLE